MKMSRKIDEKLLINKRFGRLIVLDTYIKDKVRYCKCKCDCGNEKTTTYDHLMYGYTKSCGCLLIDNARCNFKKHGKSKHPLHGVWNMIKQRCYNENNHAYKNYGGRGIKVCDEWLDREQGFINFYNWAMKNGYKRGLSVDRIDCNGDYDPRNCRLVDEITQQNNRRNNIMINVHGKNMTLKECSKMFNIKPFTLRKRIFYLGWSIDKALSTKTRTKNVLNK